MPGASVFSLRAPESGSAPLPADSSAADSFGTSSRRALFWILLASLLIRLVCLFGQPLIGADASRFLASAEKVEQGQLHEAVQDVYHPLASFAFGQINRLQLVIRGEPSGFREAQARRELAASLVNLIAGTLTVWVLFDLARRLFARVPAVVVGWLAAFQPYMVRASADIMSDALYLLLFSLALWFAQKAKEDPRWLSFFVAGGVVGLGYLARPEALALVVGMGLFWILASDLPARQWVPRLLLFFAGIALLVFPYVLIMYFDEGFWTLTRKKNLGALLGLGVVLPFSETVVQAAGVGAMVDPAAIWRVFTRWFFGSSEAYAGAALIGAGFVIKHREWRRRHWLFFGTAASLILVWLLLLHSEGNYRYLTKRHALALVVLTLPLAARGVVGFTSVVSGWVKPSWSQRVGIVTLVAVLIAAGVKAGAPQRFDQQSRRRAAERIFDQGGTHQVIFTDREKIAYYSGGEKRQLQPNASDAMRSVYLESRAWLAFYRDDRPDLVRLAEAEVRAGRLIHSGSFPEDPPDSHRILELYLWRAP